MSVQKAPEMRSQQRTAGPQLGTDITRSIERAGRVIAP